MKTIFTLLLVTSFALSIHAQDWVHSGSKWHYNWAYTNYNPEGYYDYTYVSDSMIANKSCHQLSAVKYTVSAIGNGQYHFDTLNTTSQFIYSSGDTIYFYYNNQQQWRAVYFLRAHVGDTLGVTNNPVVYPIVDTVGTVIINGIQLRYYTFHLADSCRGFVSRGKVIERIGMLEADIIPTWNDCANEYFGPFSIITCYQDDSFPVYNIYNIGSCKYFHYTSISDINPKLFSISPNPAQNQVTLKLDHITTDMTVSICDIRGKLIQKIPIETTETSIPVTNLANGVYLLTVSDGLQSITQKLIINH